MTPLSPPESLTPAHDVEEFGCGEEGSDAWLKQRALRNQASGASRTYVARETGGRVVGYYALAAGAVLHVDAPSRIRRNMPEPIPVVVLGRLAVDVEWRGRGLGSDLLADAVRRALSASQTIGLRAMLVHTVSERAKKFYEGRGFRDSRTNSMDLMIALEEAARVVSRMVGRPI